MRAKLEAFGVRFWVGLCAVCAYLLAGTTAFAQVTPFDPAAFVTDLDPNGKVTTVAEAVAPVFGVGLLLLLTGAAIAGAIMWMRRGIRVR